MVDISGGIDKSNGIAIIVDNDEILWLKEKRI